MPIQNLGSPIARRSAGVILVAVIFLAAVFGLVMFADREKLDDGLLLPLVAISGVVILLGTLALVAVVFGFLSLDDPKQALGLPEGSIRAVIALALLVIVGGGKVRIPRWSFAAVAAAVALGLALMGAYFFALFAALGALLFFVGAVLGRLAARGGSRLDGDIAMAIFIGYAIGQWLPTIL